MMTNKLLNPGPVTLTTRVREALLKEDLCHREPEFARLQQTLREQLTRVYASAGQDYTTVLITGSGTAAVEMMVGSLVPSNGSALVVANGVYGERMAEILRAQGKTALLAGSEWISPMNLGKVDEILSAQPGISHVLAVHIETTTGRLNDIGALAEVCRKYNVPILLDAVSSFGAEKIDFTGWNLEACASTANKCLHGVPGIAFVVVRRSALTERVSGATSVYLNLFKHAEEQQRGSTLFTPSVQVCYALAEALRELCEQGGWQARHQRYRILSKRIFAALHGQAVKPLLASDAHSTVLTSYHMPAGYRYDQLHDMLKQAGFVIYAGQGQFSGEIFRIAVMGDLSDSDIDRLISACRQFWDANLSRGGEARQGA